MKKILATILALTMVFSLGVSAFAAGSAAGSENIESVTSGSNEQEIEVGLNATMAGAPAPTYYVTIEWTNMVFTYTATAAANWNTTSHEYDTPADGDWDQTSASVTITNHSDVAVNASAEYASTTGYQDGVANANGVTVDVSGDCLDSSEELATANGGGAPGTTTLSVSVSGDPTEAISDVLAGTITVTIDAV